MKNGHGRYIYYNGNSYLGTWYSDLKEGWGTKIDPNNNNWFSGMWKEDNRDGRGVQGRADGAKYMGQWQANKIVGDGRLVHPDGRIEEIKKKDTV